MTGAFTQRLLAAVLTCALVPSMAAAQAKVTMTPSISVGSLYDNNLFFKAVGSGDQMTLITPGIQISYETAVKMLMGEYSFDMQRSIDHPALDNLQARRHGMLDTRFQLMPRFTVGFGGRYDRTDTAGELNYYTGVLIDRRTAERLDGGPTFSFRATPKVTLSGLYNWTSETVDQSVGGNEEVARLALMRQFTPRSTFGVGGLARRFDSASQSIVPNGLPTYTTNGVVDTLSDGLAVAAGGRFMSEAALLMWTWEAAPATMLNVQAGPRYTSARDRFVPEIAVSLARKAANILNFGADYWRGESIILGVLGPVEVNSGTGHVTWPIRPNLELGVHGGVFDSQTLSQGRARVYHTEVVASWTVKGPFTIATSYGADFQRGDVRSSLLSDKQVTRQVILLRVTAAPHVSRTFQPDDPLQPLGTPSKGVK
jgi:hypothetical protein